MTRPVADGDRWVMPLAAFGRDDVSAAGGKAANLGELVRAGLPVPDGFVVTTAAYADVVDALDLRSAILALVPAADPVDGSGQDSAYATAADSIAALFTTRPVPEEVAARITAAYRELGEGPVAVRSSATAEDLEGASFAGQQDTYLNITGADAVLDAVRQLLGLAVDGAGHGLPRPAGHRPRRRAAGRGGAATGRRHAAGVMFTADPRTGRRDTVAAQCRLGSRGGGGRRAGEHRPAHPDRTPTSPSPTGRSPTRRSRRC